MTQLDANISSSDTVIVVDTGSEQDNGFRFRIDDEILTFLGYDRDSTADILGYLGGDRTRWRVARGQDGTTAASHLAGADLFAVAPAFATSEDLTAPSPFAGGATPTLAAVLAEGNDPGGTEIRGATVSTNVGAGLVVNTAAADRGGSAQLLGGDGIAALADGGSVLIGAGWGDGGNIDGAYIEVDPGLGDGTKGKVAISTDGSTGPGPLVSDGTNLTYSRAAFVTNGSTVDQLRDALIAAGLMDPAP